MTLMHTVSPRTSNVRRPAQATAEVPEGPWRSGPPRPAAPTSLPTGGPARAAPAGCRRDPAQDRPEQFARIISLSNELC